MFGRSPWKALLLVGFAVALAGCTNNLVDSILVTPSTQSLTVGQTVQFTATGLQTHGTHPSSSTNVTDQVAWASSAPSIVSINATGLATAVSAGSATIGATMQGFGGLIGNTAVVTVTGSGVVTVEPLASLIIDPGSQTALAVNQTVDFIAIGTTGSGATVNLTGQSAIVGTSIIKAATWTSSNPAVATVNPSTGIATALTSGSTTITAQAVNPDGTVVIGNATLTVTLPTASAEPLISMTLIPGTQTLTSSNQPAQFIAIGTTGTGTTVNLTNKVVWTSSSPTVASINANTGLATALSSGTTAITAVATNPDGTVVTGVGSLTVSISATAEPIVSLAIVPGSQTASVVNQTAQFTAIGTTSSGATVNLTNQAATVGAATISAAVWGSSSTTVAAINPATGLATAISSGAVAITAQVKNPDGTVVTGTATFTVTSTTEPLVSLSIVPGTQTLVSAGETAQYIAIGTTSTGATVNLTNAKATIGTATIDAATWGSSTSAVAAINPLTGVATAGTTGVTVITAVAYNPDGTAVTATATLNVNITATGEPLVSLAIIPVSQATSVVGQTVQFIAIGTTTSGATVNLTNQPALVNGATINAAVWGSSSTAVATINPATGLGTAVSTGSVAITAQAKNPDGTVVTGTATFTVTSTPEPLVSLTVVPASQTLVSAGETEQFIAIGTTSTGATVNLTNVKATIGPATINAAVWASSTPAVATISPGSGVAAAVTSGVAVITAVAYNPDGTAVTGTATLTVSLSATPEPLVSLAIVPTSQTASVTGQTAQFTAIGTTANGTTVNLTNQSATVNGATINAAVWGSSSNAIATVSPATGVATAVSAGTVAITAQAKNPDGTVVTAAATFTVINTPEPLVSLSIVPATQTLVTAGETTQYIAIGTTASGATVNLTNAKATIGSAVINAAAWASSTTSVATINAATGLAVAATSGITVITAVAYNPDGTAVTGTSTLNVNIGATAEPLVSLSIVPSAQTASVTGQTAQFIAIGTTSSGTTVNLTNQSALVGTATIAAAVWGSSSNAIATISPATGLATAVSSGTVAITAQAKNPDGTVVTGAATFTVTPTPEPLVSLSIVPATQSLSAAGQTAQYIAIGTTSTGATVNLTNVKATIGSATINAAAWASSNVAVATVNPVTGVATAAASGVTVITAVAYNPDGTAVTGTATLTASILPTPEPLVSLAIVPASQTATVTGQTAQFIAIGTTSTGTTVNLTNQSAVVGTATIAAAVWGSSSPAVAAVNSGTGVATAVSSGTVAITAQAKNPDGTVVTGIATFTVTPTPEPLVSLSIVPATQSLSAAGQPAQFIAIGTTSSGATVNLTNVKATIGSATIDAAVWGSSSMSVATIGAATGLATAGTSGVTAITAIAYNPDGTAVTGTATLTVNITPTPEPLVSLAIVPASQQALAINQTAQFIAIGTTSLGTTVNLTNQSATVGSSTIAAASWISSNPAVASVNATTGVATALSAGTAAIIAIAKNPDGSVVTGTAAYTVTIPNVAEPLVSMAIVPATQTLTLLGQNADLQAIATTGTSTTVNLTNQSATVGTALILPAVWASSVPGVATVNAGTGVVTAVNAGTTVITATASNPDGTVVTGVAVITVTATGGVGGTIASITVIPGTQGVPAPNATAQYIAIGTTTTGGTVNLTNSVTWSSSSAQIGTIGAATGFATGVGAGSATITALYTPAPPGNVVTGTAQFTVEGGTIEEYTAVTLIPNALTVAVGQTSQFIALGTLGSSGLVVDVTASPQITWSSDATSLAMVNSTGLITGENTGTPTITVELMNPDGTVVSATADVTVSATTAPEPLVSLTIIPPTLTVGSLQETGQFLAIGTFSVAPFVRDLTNAPTTTWISSFPDYFPVDTNSGGTPSATAGIVTAYNSGSAVIIAESANPDGTIQTATALFNCPLQLPSPDSIPPLAGSCYTGQVGPLKATLTVYGEGLDTTDWYLTAPSATNTPDVIHCGPGWTADGEPGGSVCVAIYPINTVVTITAGQSPSPITSPVTSTFGGWTYNCIPTPATPTAAGANSCTIDLDGTNATVGAIFN
jgi:uncharacterized protein YjdB